MEHSEQFGNCVLLYNSFLKSKKYFTSQDSALAVFLSKQGGIIERKHASMSSLHTGELLEMMK